MSTEFWITIVIYVGGLGLSAGCIITKIKILEKKQDKHNNFVARFSKLEAEHDILYANAQKKID